MCSRVYIYYECLGHNQLSLPWRIPLFEFDLKSLATESTAFCQWRRLSQLPSSHPPSIRLPTLSCYSYYLPFPPSFLSRGIRLSAKFFFEAGGCRCALRFRRTDRQAYEISYPAPLSSRSLSLPPPLSSCSYLSSYSSLVSLSYLLRSVHSPRLYRLKDVDSASNPLSIPPFSNPSPSLPDASFFLRILYVRGKEFDSVVPARKTSSRICGGAGIFIPEGAPKAMSRERWRWARNSWSICALRSVVK